MNAAQHASQRLNERGALVVHRVRDFQHVFGDDAAGDAHVLSVGAVVKQKIFAKIFLAAAAVIAAEAGRGICGDYTNAHAPARVNALAYCDNFADHFVAEYSGRTNHFCVIAALPYFQISAIGQREANAQQHFVGGKRWNVDFFNAQILAAIKHRGSHFGRHNATRQCYDFAYRGFNRFFR